MFSVAAEMSLKVMHSHVPQAERWHPVKGSSLRGFDDVVSAWESREERDGEGYKEMT